MALRLWLHTWLTFTLGAFLFIVFSEGEVVLLTLLAGFASCIGSLPALVFLLFGLNRINPLRVSVNKKIWYLLFLQFTICLIYGLAGGLISGVASSESLLQIAGIVGAITGILFACNCVSLAINYRKLRNDFFIDFLHAPQSSRSLKNKTIINMEHNEMLSASETQTSYSNKILIKGIITGVLILVMLIPTVFISNLVSERQGRQKEVVEEVSNKWAKSQTITGPYMVIPYKEISFDEKKKPIVIMDEVIILPETLSVKGNVLPEKRLRSIYTVLLYKSRLHSEGFFKPVFPSNIKPENLILNEARICIGLSDFKGIEERVAVNFNGKVYDLTPGLPSTVVDSMGLSCSAPITMEELVKELTFKFDLKIKGSEQLHLVPLSGSSSFELQSSWPNPSFDGTSLPTERVVNDQGFTAKWSFNRANLPFSTVSKDFKIDKENYAFGVSMLQPADQYAKTSRSVKYAVLFIGLTFSLFFIIELLQKKPVHPVQYVLVGLALIIFYSLLLSFSEFVVFNNAYLIAATATVVLIALYAKGHFASWRIAGLFALVLGALYGFIFVLIQLEDTALLVGSIGLFLVIAVVMYASRKINWYHPKMGKAEIA